MSRYERLKALSLTEFYARVHEPERSPKQLLADLQVSKRILEAAFIKVSDALPKGMKKAAFKNAIKDVSDKASKYEVAFTVCGLHEETKDTKHFKDHHNRLVDYFKLLSDILTQDQIEDIKAAPTVLTSKLDLNHLTTA